MPETDGSLPDAVADAESSPPGSGAGSGFASKALILFLGLLVVYQLDGGFHESNDTAFNTFLPRLVLEQQTLSVTPTEVPAFFDWQLRGQPVPVIRWDDAARQQRAAGELVLVGPKYFLVPTPLTDERTGEKRYANTFGVGTGLTALPAFAVAKVCGVSNRSAWMVAKVAASVLVALSAVFVFLTCVRFTTPWRAFLIAITYGLGTCVWSISSQALWQHGPSEFFLALGTLCLTRSRGNRMCAAGCGLAFALAVTCRAPNALVVVAVALHFLLSDRKGLVFFLLGGLPIAVGLGLYQHVHHGAFYSPGRSGVDAWFAQQKTGSPDLWQTPLGEGLAGLLVSPGRGLLVYSPVLIFGLVGLVLVWFKPRYRELRAPAIGAVALILLAAKWYDWWGGWCFGYRPIVDVAPLLAVLMLPLIEFVTRNVLLSVAFATLLTWSIGVQFLGAFAYHPPAWNAALVGFRVVSPSGEKLAEARTLDEANRVARGTPGSAIRPVHADIDMPEFRRRLWSVGDCPILFMAKNFAALRHLHRESNKSWVTAWE